jgi:hypothetical protein
MRDSDVRRAMRTWLAAEYAHDQGTWIVEEMGVWSGSVRIDIAVINGHLSGYELKSDRDTLERLPRQMAIYGRVFDFLHLVVGERHAEKAQKMLPAWWGIMVACMQDGEVRLTSYHEAEPNPSPDPYLIAEMLDKEEAVELLDAFGLAKGWRSKKLRPIHERLAVELPFDELKEQVRSILKRRPRRPTACSISQPQYDG